MCCWSIYGGDDEGFIVARGVSYEPAEGGYLPSVAHALKAK